MSEVASDPELDWDAMAVVVWRQRQLERAGFSEFTAYRIASALDVDYRRAVDLLRRGASEIQVADLLLD